MEFAPLVNDILDQLPAEVWMSDCTTFLDPAFGGGQFLREIERRLREAGHSQDNISSRVYGCEIRQIRINWTWDHGGVKTRNLIKTDFVSYDGWGNMKFDVIVGNPPYQLTNSKKLWPEFVLKSMDLLKPGGYMGMVIPATWLTSDGAVYKKVRTRLTSEHNLLCVSRDADNHFDVGQDICYFVSKFEPYAHNTTYMKQSESVQIDLEQGLPKTQEEQAVDQIISIMLDQEPKIKWILNERDDCIKSSDLHATKTKEYAYKVYQSTANVGYVKKEPEHYGKLKLAVNFSSSFYSAHAEDHNMPITTDGIGSLMGYVLIKSKKQGEQIRSYLCSKAVRFLVNNYKKAHTGFNTAVKRRMIPQVPDHTWTDAEVYAHFGFTKAQIALIESHFK